MAASDKKLQSFTAFNSGEYSRDLAGRTDLESFGTSTRFCCNFLSQVSGGLKKFYGTRHITEQTLDTGFSKVKLIPFVNKYEPMVFVIYGAEESGGVDGLKVGLVYGNNYETLSMKLPNTIDVDELRWKQVNDRLILCHKSIQPMTIDFYGIDDNGQYVFNTGVISFKEIPYFTVGSTNDYFGPLTASGLSGKVTLTIPSGTADVSAYFPDILIAQSTYTRHGDWHRGQTIIPPSTVPTWVTNVTVNPSTIYLKRVRNGVTTTLAQGTVNDYTIQPHHGNSKIWVTDRITQERVLQVIKTVYPDAYISGTRVFLYGISDHQVDDEYYMDLSVGSVYNNGELMWGSASYTSEHYVPTAITTETLDIANTIGRKIKFYFDDDTVISPWWQGKTIGSIGEYAYSNGHWYKALSTGTCGNIQPSHTSGTHSDGGVAWKYVHSGSATATVIDVPDASTIEVLVADGTELPANANNVMKVYAWSIWGKDGIHPSEVYMVGNRLGFVCNTLNYGAWNAMSVTDDYFNFDTEEYGEQLDTSAIVHLIGNNESSDINWVLARKDLYMGGYSGEYHVTPSANGNRAGAYTPTTTYTQNISNMGGKAVIPLKYKELNMFVGLTGKELYTIAYDYTIDDYTPKSLGYLTQHIMERGIKRIEGLNNLDRNIYLLHDTKQLSLFNYAAEQKVMGFTELDFADEVWDFATTYSKSEVAAYVVTKRNANKITIERFAIEEPNYMFDEILQGNGTLADFQPVPHFANRTVYIRYGENFSQFTKATLDATGDISHDPATGVYMPQAKYFKVGLPMTSEVHTQPAFGNKVEGHQQQSLSMYMRIVDSGAFEYGSSVDFTKYFKHEYWNTQQEYGSAHRLFTGDMKLEIPLGYAEAQNQGEGPYPNTSAVGINIKSDTPEPLNILSIQEIYR